MGASYKEKIKAELEKLSDFKKSVEKVSEHLLELDRNRVDAYKVVIKDMTNFDVFRDMIRKDTKGSVKAFREAIVLEIRYINSIYIHFDRFKSSLSKLLDSAPDKYDNEILEKVDGIFDGMCRTIRKYMSDLVKDLDEQLISTHMSKPTVFLTRFDYFAKKERVIMTERFKDFVEGVKSENNHRKEFREDIQNKRRILEGLMPKITTVLKKKAKEDDTYESSGNTYISDASSAFSSISSISGSSGISMPSFSGGGGSFGGGGASGSW